MLEPLLNVTVIPAEIPRESVVAFWATPQRLSRIVPPTPVGAPQDSADGNAATDASAQTLQMQALSGDDPIEVAARFETFPGLIDDLVGLPAHGVASRSVRALAHLVRFSLGVVARGRFQASATRDGVDIWTPGPLERSDQAQVSSLGEWVPPELFATVDSVVPGGPHGKAAVIHAVLAAVVDSIPRSPATAAVIGGDAWTAMGRSDVSRSSGELIQNAIFQRSTLQLRLDLPASTASNATVHFLLRNEAIGFRAVPAADIWSGLAEAGLNAEDDLLFLLRRASHIWAPLERAMSDPAPVRVDVEASEVDDLLARFAGELTRAGVEILVPVELGRRLRGVPRIQILDPDGPSSPDPASPNPSGLFTIDSLCDVSWSLQVEGRELSDEEIERLIESKRNLIRLDDGWVVLDESVLKRLRARTRLGATAALGELLRSDSGPDAASRSDEFGYQIGPTPRGAAGDNRAETTINAPLRAFLAEVARAGRNEDYPADNRLKGELRPYQRAGVAWIATLARAGFGGILADDMGLGKTIQMIAAHLDLNDVNGDRWAPTLVVCPAGLLHNWEAEFARWAPDLTVHQFHGPGRVLHDVRDGDVVVTTYGIARREKARLSQMEWGLIVADEAQAMKNRSSATATSMRALPGKVRFALTGTPVENHLGELWSILDWTTPGLLGISSQFEREVARPIEVGNDAEERARLNRVVAPFMLRRTKSDPRIVPELPPRTITDHHVSITPEQASLYSAASAEIVESIAAASGMARRGGIFKLLTALKQISNHPAQYLKEPPDTELAERSRKFDLCGEMVAEIVESGQSLVIFTQYVQMAKLLVAGLTSRGIETDLLHGGATLIERDQLVKRFQTGTLPAMVVSLRAGGIGLNLTAATHVIHFDRWWNPAVENQASDRVWRIGQTKPVQVHRLITTGTIEEKVAKLLETKQQLADNVLDEASWLTEMSDEELLDFVRLDTSSMIDLDDETFP